MARVVFFSFDYDDVWRVNQVRNSGALVGERRSGFRDKAEYEEVKRRGDAAIKKWIREQMHGCSVTCVLIGADTHESKWVHFEIEESIANGMGLVGIYIHELKNQEGDSAGLLWAPHNPLEDHEIPSDSWFRKLASERFETYTWKPPSFFWPKPNNDLGAWVEKAASLADR